MTRQKFTDFSKHELEIKRYEGITIHRLHKGNSWVYSVVFINMYGSLFVTGDYGQWNAKREFNPEIEHEVNDNYWATKIANSKVYSSETTKKRLEQRIKDVEEEWSDNKLQEMEAFFRNCLEIEGDNGEEYKQLAAYHLPDFAEPNEIVYETEIDYQLFYIFDAFEEIIRRVKKQKQDKQEAPKATPVTDLDKQYEQYLQLVGLNKEALPNDFIRETKRSFYGGCGQMLVLLDEIVQATDNVAQVTAQKMILKHQVQNFWNAEQKAKTNGG